jgi:hypothetical protein
MRHFRCLLFVLQLVGLGSAVLLSPASGQRGPAPGAIDRKDTRVEPTTSGQVVGRVYDADTGVPIEGATVVVQQDGVFAERGPTLSRTDALGGYTCKAVLGRVSSNFDIARALLSSPLGMLLGTATNTTKRIDVARLTLRVTAAAYQPLEAPVTARRCDASMFRLEMEPILLVGEGSSGVSTAAEGWGTVRIRTVEVEPSVAKPGDRVKLRAWLTAFGEKPWRTAEVGVVSDLWRGIRKLRSRGAQPDGSVLFEGDYGVGRNAKSRVSVAEFRITKSLLDYMPTRTDAPAIIQVAAAGEDERAAVVRREAVSEWLAGKVPSAAAKFATLSTRPAAEPFDLRSRGALCE